MFSDGSGCCFLQAEDGIRDLTVTGVQTCALPISPDASGRPGGAPWSPWRSRGSPPGRHRVFPRRTENGRAPCRERVEISVGAGSLKNKRKAEAICEVLRRELLKRRQPQSREDAVV